MEKEKFVFDLIQEITLNDGTRYYELGNIMMNGRAEKAALKHLIKQVRIMQLNIPRSTAVRKYEDYINENYTVPPADLDEWEQWAKPDGPVKEAYDDILRQNHIG